MPSRVYVSAKWKFDAENQEVIFNDGEVITLPSRLSLCLQTLLDAAGQTVSYEELLIKVWGTTHRDASTITSVISELRKALSTSCGELKFIQTVPKKGYRFVADIRLLEAEDAGLRAFGLATPPVMTSAQEQVSEGHSRDKQSDASEDGAPLIYRESSNDTELKGLAEVSEPSKSVWLSVILRTRDFLLARSRANYFFWFFTMLVIAGVAVTEGGHIDFDLERADSPALFSSYEVLSFEKGLELEFDVSEDGGWLIYVHQHPSTNQKNIRVKSFSSDIYQEMVVEPGIHKESPSFSQDLTKITYIKNSDKGCEVWLMDFDSGFVEESARRLSSCGASGFWITPEISRDGGTVFFAKSDGITEPFRIFRHDLATSYQRSFSAPSSDGRGDYSFSISPDGSQMAIIRNRSWELTQVLIKNLLSGDVMSLVQLPYLIEHIAWLNDKEIVYRNLDNQLQRHHIYSDRVIVMSNEAIPLRFPVVAGGSVFAYRGFITDPDIVKLDGLDQQNMVSKEFVSSAYADHTPMVGSDQSMFFLSNRSGKTEIWQWRSGGAVKVFQPDIPAQARSLQYSEKNQRFFGLSQSKVFMIELGSDEIHWPIRDSEAKVYNISLSDEEDSLLITVGENESWNIERMDIDTGAIESLGLSGFTARKVGNNIYYTKFRQPGLWKFDMESKDSKLIVEKFEAYSTALWDFADNMLVWAEGNIVKRCSLFDGESLPPLTLEGDIRQISCSTVINACLVDRYGSGETEIVKFIF